MDQIIASIAVRRVICLYQAGAHFRKEVQERMDRGEISEHKAHKIILGKFQEAMRTALDESGLHGEDRTELRDLLRRTFPKLVRDGQYKKVKRPQGAMA